MIAAPVKAGRSPVATLQRWLRAAGISIHWGADGRQLLRNKFALYFEYRVAVSLAFIEPGDHLLYGRREKRIIRAMSVMYMPFLWQKCTSM